MLQRVLAKTGAVFQAAQKPDQFRMQSVDTGVKSGALTFFFDLFVHIFLGFLDYFLDPTRMDTAV